jgi:hypothetical protein
MNWNCVRLIAFALSGGMLLAEPSGADRLGQPSSGDLYGRLIGIETNAGSTVTALAGELKEQLEDMVGMEFTVTAASAHTGGILLMRAAGDLTLRYPDLGDHAAKLTQLAGCGTEGYCHFSTGADVLYLVGNSDDALSLAVYDYLWRLGWRALLPGDRWLDKPQRTAITLTLDVLREPDFRLRTFFGTGGFGGVLPLDAGGQAQSDWSRWMTRNRFGGSIAIGGHAGEAFNTEHQATLEANPNMRAYNYYPTSRVPFSVSMKPDASDAALQALYVGDRVAAYVPGTFAVSVEPADGGGFCVCPSCTQYDTASSQVFGLAKRVAAALNIEHPGAKVSLYAYNMHAGVPANPDLRAWLADPDANVYVQVAPYAFQRTGLSAADLARAWADAKPNNRGIRDYWAITDWSLCLPKQPFAQIEEKVQFWRSLGYDSLNCESSYSIGSVGVFWHMAGRMLFDSEDEPVALRLDFYEKAFGPAAPAMRRMIERWGVEFTLCEQELGLSFLDLAEARALANGTGVFLDRVNDYAGYVHYLRRFHEYQDCVQQRYAIGSPERHAAAEAVLRWCWQTYGAQMVHAYRMNQLMLSRYEAGDAALLADWNTGNTWASGWAWVRTNAVTGSVMDGIVADGVADYATTPGPVPFEQPAYSDQLVPLDPDYILSGELTAEARYGYRELATFIFHARPGIPALNFKFTPGTWGTSTDLNRVEVFDPDGSMVYSNWFGGNGIYGSNGVPVVFTVDTSGSGNYRIEVSDPQKFFHLAADRNLPFVRVGKLTSSYWVGQKAYFYVPHGATLASIYAPGALPVEVANADQVLVTPTLGNGIGQCNYPVQAGQDGKIWSLAKLSCATPGAYPLNLPRIWSFSATGSQHGMMVPANSPPTVDAGSDRVIVAPTYQIALAGRVVDDFLSSPPGWTCMWSQVEGPASGSVSFNDAARTNTLATFDTPGTYVLRLTATDLGGLSAADDVTVTVVAEPPNKPPQVAAGTNLTATVLLPVPLGGVVTDDGMPLPGGVDCWWTEVRGPGTALFENPGMPQTDVRFDAPGDYLLRLTATDGELTTFDEVVISAMPDYGAPTYRFGETGVFGTSETFNFNSIGQTFSTLARRSSARFRAYETAAVDRVMQRLIGVDANTTVQIGIMSDNGYGEPSGVFLACTAANYRPAVGDSYAWAVFTQAVTLIPLRVYHIVTQATALGASESFMVYCSGGNETIRPFDRATDTLMKLMVSADAGTNWTVQTRNPFFTLANGDSVVGGPGNAQQGTHVTALQTRGGTGQALGQAFTISTREVPAEARVRLGAATFQVRNVGATHDLIIRLRQDDGVVLGAITVPAAGIAGIMTTYTWPFDGGAQVTLSPGRRYFFTTEFGAGSGSSEYYYFTSSVGGTATKANTWGGTAACVPVISVSSGSWSSFNWTAPALYPSRSEYDLWFRIFGDVIDTSGGWHDGSLLIVR